MIRTDASGQLFIPFGGTAAFSRMAAPGSLVRVDILGSPTAKGTQVRIAGQIFTAAGISGAEIGESFLARVRFKDGVVFLHPVPADTAAAAPGIFERIGVDESGLSAFLISFYQKIGARLDAKTLNPLIRLAARFTGRELRAAEAAAILSERGIEPDLDSVDRLLRCMEGYSGSHSPDGDPADDADGGSREKERDRQFLSFVNQKKGQARHWVVIPFRRAFSGHDCAGSVRFLLDVETNRCLETRVSFFGQNIGWNFEIDGTSCRFTSNPPFKSVVFDKFVVYLKSLFAELGIPDVSWYFPDKLPVCVTGPVDLEA